MRIIDLFEQKATKDEAGYIPRPKNGQKCINCTMWRDPNKCSAVAGNIKPEGWCEWYAGGAYGKHGHSVTETELLDEGWRENLYKLVAVGALGLSSAAAINTKAAYDKWAADHPRTVQSLNTPALVPASVSKSELPRSLNNQPAIAKSQKPTSGNTAKPVEPPYKISKVAPDQVRPQPKPSLDTLGPTAKPLATAAKAAGITGIELVALMAQAAHETKMFKNLEEVGDLEYFNKYDPEFSPKTAKILGNTNAGDGYEFRGRGYLHLTGRYNYQKAGEALGYPLEDDPDLAADPDVAAAIAIWFWKDRVQPRVTDFTDIKSVTRPINSKYNGLDDRIQKFNYITDLVKKFNANLGEDGRVVRGVNTTVDVGPNEIKTQAAKFGNRVDKDGFPPFLRTNGKVSNETKYTATEWAIISGGHTLKEEEARPKLFNFNKY